METWSIKGEKLIFWNPKKPKIFVRKVLRAIVQNYRRLDKRSKKTQHHFILNLIKLEKKKK